MYLVSDDFLGHRSKFIREIAVKELLNQPKVGGNGMWLRWTSVTSEEEEKPTEADS